MLKIHYTSHGESFSDFVIRDFFENSDKFVRSLEGKKEIYVSSGYFIRLVQVMIASKVISFNEVQLIIDNNTYTFNNYGQLNEKIITNDFSDLPYKMVKKMLEEADLQ